MKCSKYYQYKRNKPLTIVIPLVMSRDRHGVWNLTYDIELLNADLVNLVENVDARDVSSIPLNNIDKFISGGVTSSRNQS